MYGELPTHGGLLGSCRMFYREVALLRQEMQLMRDEHRYEPHTGKGICIHGVYIYV